MIRLRGLITDALANAKLPYRDDDPPSVTVNFVAVAPAFLGMATQRMSVKESLDLVKFLPENRGLYRWEWRGKRKWD